MNKIQFELENAIRSNPEKKFKVLIVLKDGTNLNDINLEDANRLMDTILSAELKGSKILSIAKTDSVESIELDGEVTIQ